MLEMKFESHYRAAVCGIIEEIAHSTLTPPPIKSV